MKHYWTTYLFDLLLCIGMSAGLAVNAFAGFDTSDPLISNYAAITAVCAAGSLLLFLAGRDRVSMLIGIVCGVGLVIGAVFLVRADGTLAGETSLDGRTLFWLVTVISTALCYLLGRSRIGLTVLLLVGALMAAAFGFLQYPILLLPFLLFLVCVFAAFLYRVYMISLLISERGDVHISAYITQSLALVLLALGAAGAVYAGVIRPLDPPTQELKLITRLQSFEVLEKIGVSRKTEIRSPDLMTQNINDQIQTTQNESELPNEGPEQKEEETFPQQQDTPQYSNSVDATAISYDPPLDPAWIVLLAVLTATVLAAPFAAKHLLRRRWERRLSRKAPAERACELYEYFFKRLRYAGLRRPTGVTLSEYVSANREALAVFSSSGNDFARLTELYQMVVYGSMPLSGAEAEAFTCIYGGFRKNLRRVMGTGKYLLRYFAI